MRNQFIELVEEAGMKTDVPVFTIGDQVEVHQRILEGEKDAFKCSVASSFPCAALGMRNVHGVIVEMKASSARFRCTRRKSPRWK